MTTIASQLIFSAASRRCGIVLPFNDVAYVPADIPELFNVAVANAPDDAVSAASGGIARSHVDAVRSAIGEALERYATALIPLILRHRDQLSTEDTVLDITDFTAFSEEQRAKTDFPFSRFYESDAQYTDAYDLRTGDCVWVPASLVTLAGPHSGLATSSGVACHEDSALATLRAVQELIERDALIAAWQHGISPKRILMREHYQIDVRRRGGHIAAYDITPLYSSHRVALIAGELPYRGRSRFSIGCACRPSWEDAVEKAYLEWAQSVCFVGDRIARGLVAGNVAATNVRTFDDHALFYTANPTLWRTLPMFRETLPESSPRSPQRVDHHLDVLHDLSETLHRNNIRMFYRDLTTTDLRQVGLRVVRAISPDLIPVHHDHRYPNLGGTAPDIARRFPQHAGSHFPSPYPHPLG